MLCECCAGNRRARMKEESSKEMVGAAWMFRISFKIRLVDNNMNFEPQFEFQYARAAHALAIGGVPSRSDFKRSWSQYEALGDMLQACQKGCASDRAAILAGLRGVSYEGMSLSDNRTKCKIAVDAMICELEKDKSGAPCFWFGFLLGRRGRGNGLWAENRAEQAPLLLRGEVFFSCVCVCVCGGAVVDEERLEKGRAEEEKRKLEEAAAAARSGGSQAKPKSKPKSKRTKGSVKKSKKTKTKKNKNLYEYTLEGVVVTEVIDGSCDSNLKLGVRIPKNLQKEQMMPRYIWHRTKDERDEMANAIRLFMSDGNGGTALSDAEVEACKRFIVLLDGYDDTHTKRAAKRAPPPTKQKPKTGMGGCVAGCGGEKAKTPCSSDGLQTGRSGERRCRCW